MKKIASVLISLSFITSSLMANMFFGIEYLQNNMTYETEYDNGLSYESEPIDITGTSILIGWGSLETSSFRVYYSLLENEDTEGSEVIEYGFNHKLYFDITKNFKWSLQYGLGLGELENTDLENYIIADIGIGASYLVTKNVEFSLGYDVKSTSRSEDNYTEKASGSNIYLGISYWFGTTSTSNNDSSASKNLPTRRRAY